MAKNNGPITNEYLTVQGEPVPTDDFNASPLTDQPGVYEVIRVMDGVPLFLEKHLARFRNSATILGYRLQFDDRYISSMLQRLISVNGCKYRNVRIIANRLDSPAQRIYAHYIASSYPDRSLIQSGVHTILFHSERSNPNAKSTNLKFRDHIADALSKHGAYEALLVNEKSEVTEGSRSNFFGVKGDTLYTPPLKSVLPGVTRAAVMELCGKLGLKIIEEPLTTDMLEEMDGLFITGTSPQVLPISSVDENKYDSPKNKIIAAVRLEYENTVRDYISSHRKSGE